MKQREHQQQSNFMKISVTKTLLAICLALSSVIKSQDDLLSMVEEPEDKKPKKVYATFKTLKIGNAQTTETVKKKHLDYRISHRFGNVYDNTTKNPLNDAAQTGFGFDNASDIRNSLEYGILDNLSVGIGRSRLNRVVDGSVKWRFLTQTTNFKIPVSMAFFGSMGYTHRPTSDIYAGVIKNFETKEAHRVSYVSQLIIASKLNNSISLELLPTYVYRNFIKESTNPENNSTDVNGFVSIGFGGRIKLTKRVSLIGDYYYNLGSFYTNNPNIRNPLSFGAELETGGHVFSLFFTNASGLIENTYLPSTTDSWSKGQVKFGFSISRTFAL